MVEQETENLCVVCSIHTFGKIFLQSSSSSGQDIALSQLKREFNSHWRYINIFLCNGSFSCIEYCMSYQTKKLSPSPQKYKRLYYQNLWHISKLQKNQKKWAKNKWKVHSAEQGRPVAKHRVLKTVGTAFSIQKTEQQKRALPIMLQKLQVVQRVHMTGQQQVAKDRRGTTLQKNQKFNKHGKQVAENATKKLSQKGIVVAKQQQLNKPAMMYSGRLQNNNGKTGIQSKKAFSLFYKSFWFLDKAAPIPGVSFLKKAKILYSTKQRDSKILNSWFEILTKKQLKVFLNIQKKQTISKNWRVIEQMDSLYQSVQRKTAFACNARERKGLYQSGFVYVNGRTVNHNIDMYKPADILVTKQNIQPSRQRVAAGQFSQKHYYKKVQKKTYFRQKKRKISFFIKLHCFLNINLYSFCSNPIESYSSASYKKK